MYKYIVLNQENYACIGLINAWFLYYQCAYYTKLNFFKKTLPPVKKTLPPVKKTLPPVKKTLPPAIGNDSIITEK